MAQLTVQVRLEPGNFKFDQAAWDRYVADPNGDLAKDMDRRTFNVQRAMKVPTDGGMLRGTVRKRMETVNGKPVGVLQVGIDGLTDYLGFILNGTRPHRINPIQDRPNPHLRWFSPKGVLSGSGAGKPIFSKGVNHPGTKARDFMNEALPAAIRD